MASTPRKGNNGGGHGQLGWEDGKREFKLEDGTCVCGVCPECRSAMKEMDRLVGRDQEIEKRQDKGHKESRERKKGDEGEELFARGRRSRDF